MHAMSIEGQNGVLEREYKCARSENAKRKYKYGTRNGKRRTGERGAKSEEREPVSESRECEKRLNENYVSCLKLALRPVG